MTNADKVTALQAEALLLRPYASTASLPKLRARLAEIEASIHRLEGLPLE